MRTAAPKPFGISALRVQSHPHILLLIPFISHLSPNIILRLIGIPLISGDTPTALIPISGIIGYRRFGQTFDKGHGERHEAYLLAAKHIKKTPFQGHDDTYSF